MAFDMTKGRVAPLLARFALPLMLSSLLQQLYTLCDSVIVGRLLGADAFAAVGAAALRWRSAFLAVCYYRVLKYKEETQ